MLKKLLFGVIVGLILSEILVRLYVGTTHNYTTLIWIDDSTVGRRLTPLQSGWFVSPTGEYKTYIQINSQGWRDSEHDFEKSADTYRILFIGDSFVENFQVPLSDTFFKIVERDLGNQISDKKIEVIALGLGDTGTAQQYLVLKNYGLKYSPDLVVHLFFSGNDVKNNSISLNQDQYRPYFKLENDELKQLDFTTRTSQIKYKLLYLIKNNSLLLTMILDAKGRLNAQQPIGIPIDYQVYAKEYSAEYNKSWEVTKRLILQTKMEVENNGGQYLLLTLANNEQVNKKLWEMLKQKYAMKEDFEIQKPDRIIKQFCEEKSLSCYFMLPFFQEFVQKNVGLLTHYLHDGHWNKTGTDLAAEFITSILKENLSK